jgi:chromosome segregation ATPase
MPAVRVPTRVVHGDATDFVEVYTTDTIDAAFHERDERLNAYDGRLGSLEGQMGGAFARIGALDGTIGELDRRDREFQRQIDELRGRVDQLTRAAQGAASAQDVAQLRERADGLTASLLEHAARLQQLEAFRAWATPVLDLVNPDWVRARIEEVIGPLRQETAAAITQVRDTVSQLRAQMDAELAQARSRIDQAIASVQQAVQDAVRPVIQSVEQVAREARAALSSIDSLGREVREVREAVPRIVTTIVQPQIDAVTTGLSEVKAILQRFVPRDLWERVWENGFTAIRFIQRED